MEQSVAMTIEKAQYDTKNDLEGNANLPYIG